MAVLCYVVDGSLSLDVNLKNYVVQKNQVLLVMPNQMLVLHGESPDFMGFGIVGSVKVFNEVLTHITVNLPNYFEARLLSISDELVQIGDLYYQLIEKPYCEISLKRKRNIAWIAFILCCMRFLVLCLVRRGRRTILFLENL